jgi:hypothetical protein
MRAAILLGMALGLSLSPRVAQASVNPLSAERWHSRPLVLVAPRADDPAALALMHALERPDMQAALAERQIVVFTVLSGQGKRDGQRLDAAQTAALLSALGLRSDGPAMTLLIGKDGGVKLRGAELNLPIVFDTIDRMPMRRQEMGAR